MRATDLPIRASILRGLSTVVAEAGGAAPELLGRYGVDAAKVADGDSFIRFSQLERVLEAAAGRLGLPDLGLRMAAQQDLHIVGALAIAMENSRTIGEAVRCASRYLFVYSPAISLQEVGDPLGSPDVVGLRFGVSTNDPSPQTVDYGLGIVHRVLLVVNGGTPYGLRSVQLPHPRLAPSVAYRDFFGTDVRFDSSAAVLRVGARFFSLPVTGGNDLLRDIAIDYLETHFGHQDVPVSDLVGAIVAEQLGFDGPELTKVARLLSLHPRGLQRSLSAEGTSFTGIVDSVRRSQTLSLIATTDLPLSQIAARVGMREQSSLTRAVRRWFGTSPSQLRRDRKPKRGEASRSYGES